MSDEYGIFVFTYPRAKLIETLNSGFESADGLCADRAGHVFITDTPYHRVREFAHGGSKAIKTFYDVSIDFEPMDCSVDTTSGDLAVASGSNVVIWRRAQGHPMAIGVREYMDYCAYDDLGNLFFSKVLRHPRRGESYIGEFSKGSTLYRYIVLNRRINPTAIQWDGRYVAVYDRIKNEINRVHISGLSGTVIATVPLDGVRGLYQFWIRNGILIGADSDGEVKFWHYPAGGQILRYIASPLTLPLGVTISTD